MPLRVVVHISQLLEHRLCSFVVCSDWFMVFLVMVKCKDPSFISQEGQKAVGPACVANPWIGRGTMPPRPKLGAGRRGL